ncbi:urease subunit alpha [Apibacter muscae]|uniref:Urease subunit alpha n=1 Tax=Apibacter muscae TaxID=2509004 RepID=A0A563DKE9_9FLAO|nr:urease subunit alpha [Apibacter muscae]TWP25231.1 urease subunit alpha [Apibacter muscae]TWP30562.1 urease subunit alpha [Apibacter muscae]TWP31398.1 urease subunit alpha [Apibacter muscae]
MATISRQENYNLFGPTVGDKIRLGNTDLYIEIEKDLKGYGDENVYGGGKTLRDGMGLANTITEDEGSLDLVITNVTIIDAKLGIIKADVGIKDGKIAGIGKSGNPNTMDGVDPDLVTGASTDAISGEHLILTAGGIDGHVHYIAPQQIDHALSNGITTLFGGGIGPSDGTNGTTVTSGKWNTEKMFQAIEGLPVNIGLLGKGNCSTERPIEDQIIAGVAGLKIHEDWGSTMASIRASMNVADRMDVQVAIHSDTLNEAGFVEDTIAAIDGRTIHTYHTEGAGGGHAPDLLKVASMSNVLPSSTNPTLPFGINSQAELFDMIMVCHNLNPKIPSDVAFAESRVRPETQAAENILHDLGVLSMVSSDSQAMGRIGESFLRTFQMASYMKNAKGKLKEDSADNDNFRVLRYIAKITLNPAITFGISDVVGSIEKGKFADLVLWSPSMFAAKPKMVIKGGFITWSEMGDPNASLPTPQPIIYRPMFGAYGKAMPQTSMTFVSKAAYDLGIKEKLGLEKIVHPVSHTRQLTKNDMIYNGGTPNIEVNPETFEVLIDGQPAHVAPAKEFSLGQLYFFS